MSLIEIISYKTCHILARIFTYIDTHAYIYIDYIYGNKESTTSNDSQRVRFIEIFF